METNRRRVPEPTNIGVLFMPIKIGILMRVIGMLKL
jgi:hypothetical protein